jgi:hypothetical protein
MNYSPTSSIRSLSPIDHKHSFQTGIVYPPTPPLDAADVHSAHAADAAYPGLPASSIGANQTPSPPQAIPSRKASSYFENALMTPPNTPEDDGPLAETRPLAPDDALDFLSTMFPKNAVAALPYARKVSISAPNLGASFDGIVLALPNEPKTFYVDGKSAATVNLRERYV